MNYSLDQKTFAVVQDGKAEEEKQPKDGDGSELVGQKRLYKYIEPI